MIGKISQIKFGNKFICNFLHILFKDKKFDQMADDDKLNILFYHCCFKYSIEEYMTNSSLRSRFGLDNSKSSTDKITNLIKKAKNFGIIKSGPSKSYIPFWAE